MPAPYIHSSASVFPTEIYEEIITIISEDPVDGRANLCCCALVSRLWLFWSHRCLYRVLDFTGEAADEFKQIENLIRALRDIPHLCLRIQVFRFGVASQPSRRTYDASRAALMHMWPIMVAGRLPNLRELGFAEGGFQDTCNLNASFFASLTTFRTVTTLRLTMMGFSYVRFMRLLSSLPSLGTLAMHKLEWNDLDRSFPSEFVGPRRPDIRMLRILDRSGLLFGYDCPVRLPLIRDRTERLTEIHLFKYKASYARRLWQIMGSFRETMEVLSLDSITLYGLHDLSAGDVLSSVIYSEAHLSVRTSPSGRFPGHLLSPTVHLNSRLRLHGIRVRSLHDDGGVIRLPSSTAHALPPHHQSGTAHHPRISATLLRGPGIRLGASVL